MLDTIDRRCACLVPEVNLKDKVLRIDIIVFNLLGAVCFSHDEPDARRGCDWSAILYKSQRL